MENVRALIEEYKDQESYAAFSYHFIVIDKALINIDQNPDVAIDCSKSLIEGVCKNILNTLHVTVDERHIEGHKLKSLVNKVLNELAIHDEQLEGGFIENLVALIEQVGRIRNKRGDVSHGHISPKIEESTPEFASMIMAFSASVTLYLLRSFFAIDLPVAETIKYEDNVEFNSFLDDLHRLKDELSYSRALYDQSYNEYRIQLSDFDYQQEFVDE